MASGRGYYAHPYPSAGGPPDELELDLLIAALAGAFPAYPQTFQPHHSPIPAFLPHTLNTFSPSIQPPGLDPAVSGLTGSRISPQQSLAFPPTSEVPGAANTGDSRDGNKSHGVHEQPKRRGASQTPRAKRRRPCAACQQRKKKVRARIRVPS